MSASPEKTVQDIEALLAQSGYGDTTARQTLIDAILDRAWPRLERQARSLLRHQFPSLRDRLVVTGDVMSELFVRVHRSLNSLLGKGDLDNARHALNVAAKQLRYVLLDFSAQRNRGAKMFASMGRADDTDCDLLEPADPGQTPSGIAEHSDEIARLKEHFQALPAPYREVIDLHYYMGLCLKEIAELLNIEEEAAKKRLQRARRALGMAMTQQQNPECVLAPINVN